MPVDARLEDEYSINLAISLQSALIRCIALGNLKGSTS
jgi:hypothetical protein